MVDIHIYFSTSFFQRILLTNVEERTARYYDGAWQKIVYVVLSDKSLQAKNIFECEMLLPHTTIRDGKTFLYEPSKNTHNHIKEK